MGKSLREIRKQSGMKINEIAFNMDIHSSILYSWENGVRLIPVDKLNALLKLYNYPIQDFDFDELVESHKKREQVTING